MNYYNENDPFAAAWLRGLIVDGLIPKGLVDERSIEDVRACDLWEFTQCHFFAGIGGWSYALALAGWPEDRPVWTGSCPCQPFSAAGKQQGAADKRHLWPEMFRLIQESEPERIFGEQVEAAVRLGWLDGVFADLEGEGYTCGAAVLGAHSVGAPHIRQRIYWLADAEHAERRAEREADSNTHRRDGFRGRSDLGRLADANGGLAGHRELQPCGEHGQLAQDGCSDGGLGDADAARSQGRRKHLGEHPDQRTPWASGILIPCADGKARRVEPGIFPLAHGFPNRVGVLRGAGNAIVPQVAAEFILAASPPG